MKTYRAQGFTLIEILLVLFFISVMSVTVSFGLFSSDEKRLHQTGKKLFAQMNFALDESLMQQQLIGLSVVLVEDGESSYQWLFYEKETWQTLDEPFAPTVLPEYMALQISVDDELQESLLEKALGNDEETSLPSIIFYPNSEVSEFTITLSLKADKEQVFEIYINERGELEHSLMINKLDK